MASLAVRTPASATHGRRGRAAPGHRHLGPGHGVGPAGLVETLDAGDAVVVVGSVRRRFFATRSGAPRRQGRGRGGDDRRATDRQLEQASTRARPRSRRSRDRLRAVIERRFVRPSQTRWVSARRLTYGPNAGMRSFAGSCAWTNENETGSPAVMERDRVRQWSIETRSRDHRDTVAQA